MQADIRWLYLASLGVLVSLVSIFAAVQPVVAYSAAQTEAQSDPYAFPNVDLCCKPKPPTVPFCSRYPNARRCVCKRDPENPICFAADGDDDPWSDDGGRRRTLVVDCGAASYPGSRIFGSLQEAVDYARPRTTILVRGGFPGGDCREHVRIEKSLTIEGQGNSPAIVNGCLTITGPGRPTVYLRNLQILGTTTGLNGTDCQRRPVMYTGFDGRNYPQNVSGDYAISALSVAGSTVYGDRLLVRSAQAALDTEQSIVWLKDSTLAANPGARFSVRMDRTEASLEKITVAGGVTGISAQMLDRHPMRLSRVDLQSARSQYGDNSRGARGLVVRVFDEGLPALPTGIADSFTWEGGTVQGFDEAVDIGQGVVANIDGIKVVAPKTGFIVRSGATAGLTRNTIERVEGVGINVERRAAGKAVANNVSRKSGDCFCVGGDCDDDDEDIDSKIFVLQGNACRRERSGFFGG